MSGLETAAAVASVAGSAINAGATLMGGNAQADASKRQAPFDLLNGLYRSQALQYEGQTALAGQQRAAQDAVTAKNLALSKVKSIAAASGGGAGPADTSVTNIEAQIERQGEYNKAVSIFSGVSQKQNLDTEAQNALIGGVNKYPADQYAASQARSQARLSALGTLAGGAGSAFDRYAKNVPFPNFG